MRLRDCILLGSAKLRLRRRRTIVSCLTIGLLFGVIVMGLTVCGAFFGSLANMSNEVFDGKIYVEVGTRSYPTSAGEVWERAEELYEASDNPDKQNPIITMEFDDGYRHSWLDPENEFAKVAIKEYYERTDKWASEHIAGEVAAYGGKVVSGVRQDYGVRDGSVSSELFLGGYSSGGAPGSSIKVFNRGILEPFITTVEMDADAVHIVITDKEAGKLLGMEGVRNNAPREERYRWFRDVREKAAGMTFANMVAADTEVSESREIKYRVVGVIPAGGELIGKPMMWERNLFIEFFDSLSTDIFYGSLMPEGFQNEYFFENYESNGGIKHVVEFDGVDKVARYLEDVRCVPQCVGSKDIVEFATNQTDIYFSGKGVNTAAMVAALFFGVIAVFVLIGVFNRIIAEERQATAIFRAVGASKGDIRKIYLVYALMLSGITAACAVGMGLLGATVLHFVYSGSLTYGARAMYGLMTDSRVWLVGFDVRVLLVVGVIMVIGVLCTLALSDKMITKSIVSDLKE